jgi:hypothetical protein
LDVLFGAVPVGFARPVLEAEEAGVEVPQGGEVAVEATTSLVWKNSNMAARSWPKSGMGVRITSRGPGRRRRGCR